MSQADNQTREIDGHTYTVHHLDPDRALSIACELEHLLLPAVGEILAVDKDGEDGIARKAVAAALQRFVSQADEARVKKVVSTMMRVTTCNGVGQLGDAWKLHFHGRFWSMLKVTAFAVEVNFFDFFADSAGTRTSLTGLLKDLLAGAFASPPSRSGGSGDSSPKATPPA